jgi:hypothetical protein
LDDQRRRFIKGVALTVAGAVLLIIRFVTN